MSAQLGDTPTCWPMEVTAVPVEVIAFPASDDEDEADAGPSLSHIPKFAVAADFLGKSSQVHASPLTAFGDLIDNARESKATHLFIDTSNNGAVLTIEDNGTGMTEAAMLRGLASIGYTSKDDLATGKHYGFGCKTSIPRLADYALILTRESRTGYRTVGLLSSVFCATSGADESRLPLCSWE